LLVTHNLEEAIALADHLFLLSPSPTHVIAELPIPQPRSKRTPEELAAFRGQIARKLKGA
jgi:NitT/TauT family transport system ATP-binding protein